MATLEQLSAALVKADAAGNTDDARALAAEIRKMRNMPKPKAEPTMLSMLKDEALTSLPGGLARGVKDVIDTGASLLSRVAGKDEAARIQSGNDAGKAEFKQAQENVGAGGSNIARVGGNIIATAPVAGVLGAGAKALGATRLGNALASGGFSTGGPTGAGFIAHAADLGLRIAGGAGTGYVSAGLIDPESAKTGAIVGGLLPPVTKLAGAAGSAASSVFRPFTSSGQDRIAGNTLRQFAAAPAIALENLKNSREMIPGSLPTSVAAAGDDGLAGLSRTLQSADPRYAAELSSRMNAQNAARTAALEGVAGNTGKVGIAKSARDAATGSMRETVLDSAGRLPAKSVLDGIDKMLSKPDNAGELSQAALNKFRAAVAKNAPDGVIDARALYAIRKDINEVLGGKLQGEAGNLRYAAGQLSGVKGLIDDAIDQASRAVNLSESRAISTAAAPQSMFGGAPRPSWRGYLERYAQESIPINQMEKLDEVMNAVSTGSVDQTGNAILSAAKLNNYLRNNSKDLQKLLSGEQLDLLRRLSADLNASQLAANSGKALGSNTVQNLSGVNALASLVGTKSAGSTPVQATLGRGINWLYKKPDEAIMNKLGQAMLDPKEAARLMADPQTNRLLEMLANDAGRLGYRAAPALAAQ